MEITVIESADSLEQITQFIDNFFKMPMRLIQMNMSIFEQYQMRPIEAAWIKGIWKYRVVVSNGKYVFGKAP